MVARYGPEERSRPVDPDSAVHDRDCGRGSAAAVRDALHPPPTVPDPGHAPLPVEPRGSAEPEAATHQAPLRKPRGMLAGAP